MTDDQTFTLILRRLDGQDASLSRQDGVLDRILSEVRRTNGRVTALENRIDREEAVETAVEEAVNTRQIRSTDKHRRLIDIVLGAIGAIALVGGSVAEVLHLLGVT